MTVSFHFVSISFPFPFWVLSHNHINTSHDHTNTSHDHTNTSHDHININIIILPQTILGSTMYPLTYNWQKANHIYHPTFILQQKLMLRPVTACKTLIWDLQPMQNIAVPSCKTAEKCITFGDPKPGNIGPPIVMQYQQSQTFPEIY